jgi:hypothetical protein
MDVFVLSRWGGWRKEMGGMAYYASENPVTPNASNPDWITFTDKEKEYSRAVDFTLSAGNGEKTMYIWFKDSSDSISDVKIDTTKFFKLHHVDAGIPAARLAAIVERVTVGPASF